MLSVSLVLLELLVPVVVDSFVSVESPDVVGLLGSADVVGTPGSVGVVGSCPVSVVSSAVSKTGGSSGKHAVRANARGGG